MKNQDLFILFYLILVLSCGFLFYVIGKHARNVHDHLANVLKMASETNDKDQLEYLLISLKKYANQHCYHRHLMSHARNVAYYIQGKLDKNPD